MFFYGGYINTVNTSQPTKPSKEFTMTRTHITALAALALSITLSGVAHAETGLSREQVRAELIEAQRNGDLIDYETGLKQNQLFPSAYPRAVAQIKPIITRSAARSSHVAPAPTGSIELDAIAQRNAEALARRPATLEDGQFAGNNR